MRRPAAASDGPDSVAPLLTLRRSAHPDRPVSSACPGPDSGDKYRERGPVNTRPGSDDGPACQAVAERKEASGASKERGEGQGEQEGREAGTWLTCTCPAEQNPLYSDNNAAVFVHSGGGISAVHIDWTLLWRDAVHRWHREVSYSLFCEQMNLMQS